MGMRRSILPAKWRCQIEWLRGQFMQWVFMATGLHQLGWVRAQVAEAFLTRLLVQATRVGQATRVRKQFVLKSLVWMILQTSLWSRVELVWQGQALV